MASYKTTSLKLSFVPLLTGMFFAFLLVGCGQNGERQTTLHAGTEDNFSSPIPTQLEKARPGLTAKVIVDGGTASAKTVDLQIVNDQVQGTIPDLPVGQHTFEIQFFIDGVLVATSTVNANIQAGAATPVAFDSSFVFPDTDGDGASNLNEIEIFGSGSNAWNDINTKPEISVVVNPQTAILPPNGVQTFTAAIAQNTNQGVTWSVQGDNSGSITPGGTYTAAEIPGTYNVVATSQADTTKSAIIPVTVVKAAIDSTFDADGIVTTTIGTGSSSISDLAVQTDGKIIAVGISVQGGANQFTLARYNIDGTPDATFDGDGIVTTTTIGASSFARTVALQTNGKIVVGGDSGGQFALTRYNIDGTLDTTFDTDGIVTTTILTSGAGLDLVIQGDGKIVLAGQSTVGGVITATLVRYNRDGTPDTTFDTDGVVTAPAGEVRAVALQSDGRIIIAGRLAGHFFLARYNSNGSPDTTFDSDGIVTTAIGTASFAMDLAIQPDGKIIASGNFTSGTINLALARYNPNGSPDTTFNADGIVTTAIGTTSLFNKQAVTLQADGKIITTGPLTLARFKINGDPDDSFNGGSVPITIGTGGLFHNLALQTDGKVIVGGQLNSHFTLGRFQTAAPAVLLRANLTGSEEIPAVTTLATGSATFVISPGQTEISYTLHIADIGITGITAVQLHFGAPGAEGRALFTLTSSPFVSPLVGKLTAADLEQIAATEGINTFADAIKAMRDGNTYIHIHTSAHLGGEIRGQILEAPPTLSQLQAEIFTPECAHCHISGQPGGDETGMFLNTRENSFNLLVNVSSEQDRNFKRVEPFNPDASFLIKKLTDPTLGQMPADGPPFLSDEQIKKIRDWISSGAKND